MASKYTDDELELLSDEEREGLEDPEADEASGDEDADGEGGETTDAKAGGDDATADDAGKAAEGDAAAGDGDAAAEAAARVESDEGARAAAEQEEQAAKAKEADASAPQPLPDYGYPQDYDKRIADIDAKRDDLAQKLDDGDITAREFNSQLRELEKEARDLDNQKLRAEVAFDGDRKTWHNHVLTFLTGHPEYEKGTALYSALDGEVSRLQKSVGGSFDPTILQQAHDNLVAQMRKSLGLTENPVKKADPAKKPVDAKAKPTIPPTLAHVPAAASETLDDGGAFAALDRLADKDPEAFERAMSRLSDEQRDQYLQST